MSSGERSIGAAKGKQSDTEALCQIPPPPKYPSRSPSRIPLPHGLGVCIWMPLVNGTGNSPVSGTADPRSSQTGQVIRGLR